MRSIAIIPLKHIPLEEQEIEIVERKGLGHPDTICDSIMNEVSVNLCKEYLNKIGTIMHHNIDKSLLVAGEVEVRFGGGIVKKPMKLIFGDRATFKVDNIEIPVAEIAIQTAKDWFKKNLRFVDPEEHVKYQVEIQPGSQALTDIFRRGGKILEANDTSAAVGWAPLTKTEKMVLSLEKYLNSKDFKRRFPETGEDIKVMGFRRHRDLNLTISMAFVDRFISGEEQYFDRKAEVLEDIKRFVEKRSDGFDNVHMELNTLDTPNRGIDGVYLTVLGTSADGAYRQIRVQVGTRHRQVRRDRLQNRTNRRPDCQTILLWVFRGKGAKQLRYGHSYHLHRRSYRRRHRKRRRTDDIRILSQGKAREGAQNRSYLHRRRQRKAKGG